MTLTHQFIAQKERSQLTNTHSGEICETCGKPSFIKMTGDIVGTPEGKEAEQNTYWLYIGDKTWNQFDQTISWVYDEDDDATLIQGTFTTFFCMDCFYKCRKTELKYNTNQQIL